MYREYGRLVYAVARNMLASKELAEEATQQTFVKAWQAATSFDATRALGPWLTTIARRTCIDLHRREARRSAVNLDDVSAAHPSLVTAGPDVEQGYDAWAVRQAIDDLPDDERAVVRLQHVEGLSHVEIAEQLGVPVGTVKSRSFRAHRRLAAALGHLRQPEREHTPNIRPAEPRTVTGSRTYSRMTGEPMNDDDRIAYLAGEPTGSIDDMDDARRSRCAPGVAGRSRSVGRTRAGARGRGRQRRLERRRDQRHSYHRSPATRRGRTSRAIVRTGRPRDLDRPAPPAVDPPGGDAPQRGGRGRDHRRRGDGADQRRHHTSETFSMALEPTEVLPAATGSATLTKTDSGWRIELDATGLPRLADGVFYQAWLRNEEGTLVPIGTFNEGEDVVLWAGVSPLLFPTLTVTREAADNVQDSSGDRVLVGTLTPPTD